MTDYIGDDLPPKVIRITKGADRVFTIRRRDVDNNPVDWAADVYLSIDLDPAAPTRIDAVVTNELAVIRIESTICDQVKRKSSSGALKPTTWQAVMSQAGVPTLETPLMVGTFQPQDGNA